MANLVKSIHPGQLFVYFCSYTMMRRSPVRLHDEWKYIFYQFYSPIVVTITFGRYTVAEDLSKSYGAFWVKNIPHISSVSIEKTIVVTHISSDYCFLNRNITFLQRWDDKVFGSMNTLEQNRTWFNNNSLFSIGGCNRKSFAILLIYIWFVL